MRREVLIGAPAALLALGTIAYAALSEGGAESSTYRMAKIERGAIVKSVSASGKLNAVVTVLVGSSVSGRVSELHADFNSEVHAGEMIARIDPVTFEAKVTEARTDLGVAKAGVLSKEAAVAQARANVANGRATVAQLEADLKKAEINSADLERDYRRLNELRASGAASISSIDKAKALWDAAAAAVVSARAQLQAQQSMVAAREAAVQQAEADVAYARATVAQKEAVLNTAQVNLDNTIISSPVEGVVIGRDVDVGQTVAASLQAPTLFTIAQDLRQMQVETSIDEADIGQIVPGQQAVFTVDSFPGQEFRGVVTQVRKQATEVQSVITYTVVIAADNPELKLLPGMTASVDIRVSNRTNVLKVPSAALRFRPPDAEASLQPGATLPDGKGGGQGNGKGGGKGALSADAQREQLERLVALLQLDDEQTAKIAEIEKEALAQARAQRQAGQPANRDARQRAREQADRQIMDILRPDQQTKFKALLAERRDNPAAPARVWVLENGKPKAVPIFIGVNDNSSSELVRGDLKEGAEVIVGINRGESTKAQGKAFRFGF